MLNLRRTLAVSAVRRLCGLLCLASGASATTATATLTAGTLGFINSTPANIGFTGTLTGADQTLSSPQAFDVADATGSGAGWNITATSTTFTTGTHSLATSAATVQAAPTIACDAGASCTLATNSTTLSVHVAGRHHRANRDQALGYLGSPVAGSRQSHQPGSWRSPPTPTPAHTPRPGHSRS